MTDLIADILADPLVGAIGTAILFAGIALWLVAAWWAHSDAARRTESGLAGYVAAAWIVLSTPLMLPLSLAIYALLRPQVSAGDRRVKELARALGVSNDAPACRTCGLAVDPAWARCPACSTWLAAPCAACGRWSDATLELCPWCGEESRAEPQVPQRVAATAAASASRPLRLRRSTGPGVRAERAERTDSRRIATGIDGRRLGRARLRA